MKHPSPASGAARLPSPSRGFPRRGGGGLGKIKLVVLLFFLSVGVIGCWATDACADSDAFCFPSTLTGMCPNGEGDCKEYGLESRKDDISSPRTKSNAPDAGFMSSDGLVVSCTIANTLGVIRDRLRSTEKNDASGSTMCKGPLVPDMWMKASNGMTTSVGDHAEGVASDSNHVNGSLAPYVEISPPSLDWGEVSLYSPSTMYLTVRNLHNNKNLIIDEPFSSNSQYYAYDFESLSLSPGNSAMISFVFLPRWLGSSSAHLVLQTSFGGFVLPTKGMATDCPYRIEPFIDVDIPFNGKLSRNLSLYNPYDEMLHVEEISFWVSSVGHTNQSVHVVCGRDVNSQPYSRPDAFPGDKLFRVNNGDLGLPQLGFRPHKHWKISPRDAMPILEINIWHHFERKLFGAICLKIRNSAADRMDVVVVPLEVKLIGMTTYKDFTGSVSVYFEAIGPPHRKEAVFNIFLKNDAKYLLQLVNVSEVTEDPKLFMVKCMQGLILFPGTVTHIAAVSYSPFVTSEAIHSEVPSKLPGCMLLIRTNNSVDPVIEIPCQDIVHKYFDSQDSSNVFSSEVPDTKLSSQQDEKLGNARMGSLRDISESANLPKDKMLEAVLEDDLIIKNWRSQGRTNEISVLQERELLFPVVHVGSHFLKWISVQNPSQQPVVMQLLLNSYEIIDQCKSADDMYEHALSIRSTKTESLETRIGFSLANSAVTEAFVHPYENALFGPVVFLPSNRCTWRSSVLIRNNLSGVEWLPLQAFGGIQLLVLLEGSEPTWKLEFKFDLPINLNTSSTELLSRTENKRSLCTHRLSKEIYAKNMGELPLEVKKLKVSGTNCGLDGFMIHKCKGFALEPGESLRLLISYEADFSAAVVNRNLELELSAGMFIIPMRASLPMPILNICQKTSFFHAAHWKFSLLIFAVIFSLLLVFVRARPLFLSSKGYYVTLDSKISSVNKARNPSRLRHSTKNSRSVLVDEKRKAGYVHDYPICHKSILENPARELGKQDSSDQKEITFSTSSSTAKDISAAKKADPPDAAEDGNLTIRVIKEKGRRKKKRLTGAGISAKVEVSSSQSGNSTPSSPLSPNTPSRHVWPLAAESGDVPIAGLGSPRKGLKKCNIETSTEARAPHAENHMKGTSLPPAQRKPSVNAKTSANPAILPVATSPIPNQSTSPASSPSFSSSQFLIAPPYARAPGPTSIKNKTIKEEKNDEASRKFTYDIWGDHFPGKFMIKSEEVTRTKVPDASEGDYQSFFARDPKSLMMMPSARSVSPGCKLPTDAVTCLNEK